MGRVISFEGIPGVGKSTLVRNIRAVFETRGYKVANIRELDLIDNTKSRMMDKTQKIFTSSDDRYFRQFDPMLDTFFSQAVRYLICREVIDKNVGNLDFILEDRGIDTYMSYALAGFKTHSSPKSFDDTYELVSLMNSPINEVAELSIRLKDTVENCVARSIKRGESQVLAKDIEYLRYVDKAYDYLSEKSPNRIVTIDVFGLSKEEVLEKTVQILTEKNMFEVRV